MAGLTAARSVLMVHSLQAMQQPEIRHHTCVALRRMPTASLAELRSQLVGSSNLLLRHCVQPSRKRGFFVAAAAADIGEEEGDVEEVAGLLEPPVDSIDEAYVEALDEGTLPDDGGEEQEEDEGEDVEDLKQGLIDSLYGTQRGLRASSDTRAEVIELITQLEAKNPTPAPTEALNLLNGKWILAYTSYSELYPLLAAGNLPLLKVGEISQTIDAIAFTVENSVSFEGPLTTTSFSTSASFEVRSPKRVQIKFEEGIIGTPKLTDSIEVPSEVDIMGQKVDLTPIRGLLRPLQHVAMSVARTISGQPPLKFPIQADRAQSWLLTTFLDEDVRISRGDGGSVFVLVREGSPLLY